MKHAAKLLKSQQWGWGEGARVVAFQFSTRRKIALRKYGVVELSRPRAKSNCYRGGRFDAHGSFLNPASRTLRYAAVMTLRDCVSPPANRLMPAARVGTVDAAKLSQTVLTAP